MMIFFGTIGVKLCPKLCPPLSHAPILSLRRNNVLDRINSRSIMEHNGSVRSECLPKSTVDKTPENRQHSTEDLKMPKPASLLGLPLELRELIYEKIFRECDSNEFLPIYRATCGSPQIAIGSSISPQDFFNLILVNHQLHQEAIPLFFKWNHPYFTTCHVKDIKKLLLSLPKEQASRIRQMRFSASAFQIRKGSLKDWEEVVELLQHKFRLSQLYVDLPMDPDWAVPRIARQNRGRPGTSRRNKGLISLVNHEFSEYSWTSVRQLTVLLFSDSGLSRIFFKYPLHESIGAMEADNLRRIRLRLFMPLKDLSRKKFSKYSSSSLQDRTRTIEPRKDDWAVGRVVDHFELTSRCLRSYTGQGSICLFMAVKGETTVPWRICRDARQRDAEWFDF